ncbi:MAG: hypothetical protein ACUVWX_07270 [Kiritimatiellia bacterium]
MKGRGVVAFFCVFLAVLVCLGAEVGFLEKPDATRTPDGVTIRFALSAPTDVEIAVLDKNGVIVRRLAAGLLGKNAPKPFQRDSLRQEIHWDGKDDDGRLVLNDDGRAPFKVRVSTGMRAEFAGAAFGSEARPDFIQNVQGLAVAPDGRLCVLAERWTRAWWRGTAIHVFKRNGEYEKTIKPFPSALPPERLGHLTALRDHQGRAIPVIYRVLAMTYYPYEDLAQHMAVTPEGNLHFLVVKAAYFKDREGEKWVASLAPDGGLAYDAYAGAEIKGETAPGDVYLAPASDGRALFVTGLDRGPGESSTARPNVAAIYKVDLPERKTATVFFGEPKQPGSDNTHLNDPRGLATDGKHRLFVADRGNNRVLVVDEKSATVLTSFDVENPTWLGVSRGSGSIYVASSNEIVVIRQKNGSYAEADRIKLPEPAGRNAAATGVFLAVDGSGEEDVLWLGRSRGAPVLLRCTARDGVYGAWEKATYLEPKTYWNLTVGQDGRTVACKVGSQTLRLLDESTGEMKDLRLQDSGGQTYRLGPENQIYGMDRGGIGIMRWDRNGKPLPFRATGGRLPNRPSGTTSWERDFDVDRAGNIYVKERGKHYHGRMRVDKYDKDGNRLGTVIWTVSDGALGPRVDGAGNLYIAEVVKPVGEPMPEFFKGKLPNVPIDSKGNVEGQYWWMYGSIVKFPPQGGAVWFPITAENDAYAFDGQPAFPASLPKTKIEVSLGGGGSRTRILPAELEGAEWFHYGCSYVLDMHPGHNRRCHCTATEIDVDDYGRCFCTDQGRFRVVILDSAGNEVLAFGRYGNQDDVGPEIAFDWFTGLAATDRYVYVADGGTHRVLRVGLKFIAVETCDL